jgi:hypothetical protein
MHIKYQKSLRTMTVLLLVQLLSACTTSFVVKGSYPSPLVEKLNVPAKLVFTPEFSAYIYSEKGPRRPVGAINMGAAQKALFSRIFESFLVVDKASAKAAELVITPQVLDFQYSVPSESTLNLFEIWVKYRILIEDSDGKELADWVIKGYGKTPTATLKSAGSALNAAINIALRDVGAQISIGFPRQASIKQFLAQRVSDSPLESAPSSTVQSVDDDQLNRQPVAVGARGKPKPNRPTNKQAKPASGNEAEQLNSGS